MGAKQANLGSWWVSLVPLRGVGSPSPTTVCEQALKIQPIMLPSGACAVHNEQPSLIFRQSHQS